MAGIQFEVPIASIPLAAATAKTCVQVKAAANQRVKILGYGFYFDGATSSSVPAQIRILRQSTAGTSLVSQAVTPDESELTETIQSTCQVGSQTTQTEPTAGLVLRVISVPTYNGQYEVMLPYGQEIYVGGGGYLGFEINAPAIVNVRGYLRCEE